MKTTSIIVLYFSLLAFALLAGCGGSSSNAGGTTQPAVTPPTVTSITPTTVTAGTGTLTLTVNGTGFLTTTSVQVGGVTDVTSYVSSTQVTATVTVAQLASGSQLSVVAWNGTSGSGSSAAANLQVNNPVPAITQLTPTTLATGTTSLTVAVSGTGFVPTTVINVNSSARTTTYVSATQVNVTLTAADVAAVGSLSLMAVNATPGGGTSAAMMATVIPVNNPVPAISALSPAVVLTGGTTPATVTVTGTNFIPASTVQVGGVSRATTYVSATQLTFQVTVTEQAAAQLLSVTVVNPTPGGGSSLAATLKILSQTATPVITSVSPTQFLTGSGTLYIDVYGTGLYTQTSSGQYVLTSSVLWNGTPLTVVSAYIYSNGTAADVAQVPASLLTSVGTATITVSSSTSTPAVSNAITVTIANPPAPTLTSISPNSGLTNTAATVALYGTGFTASSTVLLNGSSIATTYQSSTELMATIPASSIATPGVVSLAVTTPAPGGGTSAALYFTAYNPPPPTLTTISPSAGPINTAATVMLYGSGFTANSTVAMNGTNIAATFVSSTELTVSIPASSMLPGNLNFTVTTPAPGGGTTASLPYTTYIGITNNDIVYNSSDGLLYASVPGSVVGMGNSIVGIDPVTGNFMRQIFVGSNPNKLALSSDGTQLFVGLDGAAAVAQVNLTTGHVVSQFSLGGGPGVYNPPYTAASLAAVPGEPTSVAVELTGSYSSGEDVTIYDSGVARTKTSNSLGFGTGPIAFGSSASILYMAGSSAVYQMTLDSTGITGGSKLYSSSFTLNYIQYDNGRLYLSDGVVLDATSGTQLGTYYATTSYAAVGPIVSDSTLGLAFVGYAGGISGSPEILAFNESTFNPSGSIAVNGVNNNTYPSNFLKILRWGQNGLALNTPTQIYIFQSPVVKDLSSSPADLSVTLGGPGTATTGSAITYTATVRNLGPNQAQGVAVALTLDASLIVNSVTASQGSCGSGSVFSCDLGILTNGASATVTVSATPSTSGTIESIAAVDSISYDPTTSNNQATASTTVTGNSYAAAPSLSAISPALVQAGSGAFTLTVTGSGFNSSSTVYVIGTALSTTFVSATELTANVESSLFANYGWAPVVVTNPSPGGGTSQVAPLTIYALVNVPANGILFDPYSQQIYATVPSAATTLTGNSIVAINPFTATVGTPVNVGSEPNVMAETADGNYLYIGLSGADSLAQFNLLTHSLSATIPLSYTQGGSTSSVAASWLAAMPGTDTTLAMNFTNIWGNFGIFDISGNTGSFRPNLSGIYSGVNPVFADATHLYAYDSQTSGAEFYRYSVNANGLTLIDGTTLNGMGGFSGGFDLANGIVYGGNGGIINPSATPPSQIATMSLPNFYQAGISPWGVGVVPDSSTQKAFLMLENAAGTWEYALARFDTIHYLPEAWLTMPASASSIETAWTMLRYGQDGLALLSAANTQINSQAVTEILLLRGPFVTPQLLETSSPAVLKLSSTTTITHGAGNTLLTLTGSNFVPGVAVTWNGSYRTTTIVDATHVTVAIPASDLASAGSGSLVATNPGASASNTLTVTIN